MLLHDITDVPLYLGKFFVYLRVPVLPTVCQAVFALSCTYFRIVNYAIIVYIVGVVGKDTKIHPILYNVEWVCLWVLYGLHLIWEMKILSHVAVALRGKEVTDRRSDGNQ
jgi:hypothetical protein